VNRCEAYNDRKLSKSAKRNQKGESTMATGLNSEVNWVVVNREILQKKNYVRAPNPPSYDHVRFSVKEVARYRKRCGDHFNLIAVGRREIEDDFYVLPYEWMRDLLTEETIAIEGDGRKSWFVTVSNGKVRVNGREKTLEIRRGARSSLAGNN
jgi:hypothetical protein